MEDGPHYNRVKQRWVLLSHDRRALIAMLVLIAAGVVASLIAFLSRSDTVSQPPGPCWPSITATPAQVHAGESLRVSSSGFQCGYLANDGKPVEYWLVLSGSTPGAESFRFGPINPPQSGAFTFSVPTPPTITAGQWSVTVEGHQQYVVPKGCDVCKPPALTPVVQFV